MSRERPATGKDADFSGSSLMSGRLHRLVFFVPIAAFGGLGYNDKAFRNFVVIGSEDGEPPKGSISDSL